MNYPPQQGVTIAYCVENESVAEKIATQLALRNHIVKFSSVRTNGAPYVSFAQKFEATSDKIIFLISDNFLKSEPCVADAFGLFQSLHARQQLLAIICDGEYMEDGQPKIVTTQLLKIKNVIGYMSFWQDKYLDLRKKKREYNESGDVGEKLLDQQIDQVRSISGEISEFLYFVRDLNSPTLDEIAANNYSTLFEKLNLPDTKISDIDEPGKEEKGEGKEIKNTFLLDIEQAESLDENLTFRSDETPETSLLNKNEIAPQLEQTPETAVAAPVGEAPKKPAADPQLPLLEQLLNREQQAASYDKSFMDALFAADDEGLDKYLDEEVLPESKSEASENIFDNDDFPETIELADNQLINDGETKKEEILTANTSKSYFTTAEQDALKLEAKAAIPSFESLIFSEKAPTDAAKKAEKKAEKKEFSEADLRYEAAYQAVTVAHDPDSANTQLLEILTIDKYHTKSLFLLGELSEVSKRYAEAKSYYEKVAFLEPKFPNIFYKLGCLTAFKMRGKKKQAAKYFKKAMKRNKKNADAAYQYAIICYEEFGAYKKADKYFKRTLYINPFHPFANYDLALMYHELGEKPLAAKYYKEASEVNNELRTAQNDRAFNVENSESQIPTGLKHTGFLPELSDNQAIEIKTVLITGATSGIGRATAAYFAQHHHRLILTGRRADRLEAIEQEFKEKYPRAAVKTLVFDVRNVADIQQSIHSLPEEWAEIDVLLNNAGLAKGLSFIHEGNLEHWDQMIDTNIKGLLYMTRLIAPKMVARGRGHIINICSTAGKEVYPKGNVYSATKFAVDSLTKSMRLDLHEHNIRVSQVSPGHVEETEFASVRFDGDAEKADIYKDFKPLKAADVAETIYFIANRPTHVNIQDVLMMSTQQASATQVNRSGRS